MNDRRVTHFPAGPTLLILVLALIIRLGISDRPLWFDEAITYWEARQSPLVETRGDLTPLPALMVKPLVERWDQPWMLRLPFIALGLAAIVLFQLAVREIDGERPALVTALILALSPFHAYYSTELRAYAIVLFAAAASFWCLLRVLHSGRNWYWLGYGAAAVLGISAHLFFSLLIAAQGTFLLLQHRSLFRRWLAVQVPIALGAAPAVYYVLALHNTRFNNAGGPESRPLVALAGTLYSFVMGMVFVPTAWWGLVVLVAALLFGALVLRGLCARRPEQGLLVLSLFLPLAGVVIVSVWVDIYNELTTRYLAFAQPFLVILAVRGWQTLESSRLRAASFAAMIVTLSVALAPMYLLWEEVGMGNHDRAATQLQRLVKSEDRIVCSRWTGLPLAYQLRNGLIHQMVIGRPEDPATNLPPAPRLWVVELHDRSMWEFVRSSSPPAPAPPMAPDGYRLVRHDVIPGRKVISITLFEHIGSDCAAGSSAGLTRRPPGMTCQARSGNWPSRTTVDIDVLAQMTTESAVTVANHRRETLTCAHLPPEAAETRAIPDLGKAALVKVAHGHIAGVAWQHRPVHLDAGVEPRHIARQCRVRHLANVVVRDHALHVMGDPRMVQLPGQHLESATQLLLLLLEQGHRSQRSAVLPQRTNTHGITAAFASQSNQVERLLEVDPRQRLVNDHLRLPRSSLRLGLAQQLQPLDRPIEQLRRTARLVESEVVTGGCPQADSDLIDPDVDHRPGTDAIDASPVRDYRHVETGSLRTAYEIEGGGVHQRLAFAHENNPARTKLCELDQQPLG
jgi:mannosyltransferase